MKFLAVDLGGVIVNVNFIPFIEKLSKTLNISIEDINYFISRTQKLHDLGLTDLKSELHDHFNIKSSIIVDDLLNDWDKTISPNISMISFLKNLIINNNVKVALLSNIGIEHAAIMKDILTDDIYNNSVRYFSCVVGVRKPNHIYYKTFLDMYPEFNGCIYLDDKMENIKAGEYFGFNSQQFILEDFKSEEELDKKLLHIKNSVI